LLYDVDRITRLSLSSKNHQRQSEQKAECFIYEQKVGKILKCADVLPKMEGLADILKCNTTYETTAYSMFILYAVVS